MAQYIIQEETLTNIADSIRNKTNNTNAIKPTEMAALIESIETNGGSAETCMVTVDFPKCTPIKYLVNGAAGFTYINPEGTLSFKEITGVPEPSGNMVAGVTSYTFDPVECKCGTVLSVATLYGINGFAKSSDAISDPFMLSYVNPFASFLLPETSGNYTITLYYGT